MKLLLKLAIMFALARLACAGVPQIGIEGESTPIALPFNQRLTAWTKIYGMGVHNSDIPATFGWSMAWRFQRVSLVAELYRTTLDRDAGNDFG